MLTLALVIAVIIVGIYIAESGTDTDRSYQRSRIDYSKDFMNNPVVNKLDEIDKR